MCYGWLGCACSGSEKAWEITPFCDGHHSAQKMFAYTEIREYPLSALTLPGGDDEFQLSNQL
jgi:hypothetical protein